MKTLIKLSLLFFITIQYNSFAQQGWYSQTSNTTNHLYSVQFLNVNTGYAAGQFGTIVKTTNSGLNWNSLSLTTSYDINKIYFINELTGFAVGQNGSVNRTTNGGNNFISTSISNFDISDVFFIDNNNGWAVINHYPNNVFKTTNNGINWDLISTISNESLTSVYFTNNNSGFAGTYNGGLMYRTVNGGLNWNAIGFGSSIKIQFLDPQNGYSLEINSGRINKTTNGGNNFVNYTIGYQSFGLYFYDINTGWVSSYAPDSGRGLIYKTINGGINWFQQYVGTNQEIRSVNFVDANTGWLVGYNGIIYKSTNGGGNPIGVQTISESIPVGYSLKQNYPNPFNPSTNFEFSIPKTDFIELVVIDVNGRIVQILANQELKAGSYNVAFDASNLSSGLYFYKLQTKEFTQTRKMVVVK